MHPKIKEIYKAHDEWMKRGGDQSILVVQQANFVQNINIALNEVEVSAYNRGKIDAQKVANKQKPLYIVKGGVLTEYSPPAEETTS